MGAALAALATLVVVVAVLAVGQVASGQVASGQVAGGGSLAGQSLGTGLVAAADAGSDDESGGGSDESTGGAGPTGTNGPPELPAAGSGSGAGTSVAEVGPRPAGPPCNLIATSRSELDRALATARVNQVVCYHRPSASGGGAGATTADVREGGPPGAGVPNQSNCTQQVSSAQALNSALNAASAGARICVTGDLSSTRLTVRKGGTAQAPVSIVGNGKSRTKGITVEANHVVVDGFQVLGAQAPGISIKGDGITVRNNTVDHPTGGDADGLRFWGSSLRIVHNTITNVNPDGGGAHADCMQTFATDSDSPASRNVLIDGNRCDKIDNQCLIAEGPNSSAGDGSGQGQSADITFSNNYCNVGASQATQIDDVTGVKVIGNEITGKPDKAFSFQNKSTGAVVSANKVATGIGYQVGMDASSKADYRGPQVGGGP
jgi:hypothetical protein